MYILQYQTEHADVFLSIYKSMCQIFNIKIKTKTSVIFFFFKTSGYFAVLWAQLFCAKAYSFSDYVI